MDKKYKDILDSVFYSSDFFAKSFPKFVKKLQLLNIDIPYNVIEFYYNNQAIVQIFKPVTALKTNHALKTKHYPIISNYPFERVQIDSMYIKQKARTLAFVNMMDIFSKYSFSKMYVINKESQNITSTQSRDAFIEFQKLIDDEFDNKYSFKSIVSDIGSEYLGSFHQYLEDKNIKHVYADAGNKKMMSSIERFNGTLRMSLEKYNYIFKKIDNNELEKVIDSYNNSHHESIDDTPYNILKNEKFDGVENINKSRIKDYKRKAVLEGWVRYRINNGSFRKIGANWSDTIHEIKKFLPLRNRYELDDGKTYPEEDLQIINKEHLMNGKVKMDKVIDKVIREKVVKEKVVKIKKVKNKSGDDWTKELKDKTFNDEGEYFKIIKVVWIGKEFICEIVECDKDGKLLRNAKEFKMTLKEILPLLAK